jgi:CDP-diacylglycerol--glycerol-3-phosphate 3-phosphatidyltransferase
MAEWYKRIPNWLTFLRLILIPVFVAVLLDPSRSTLNVAAIIFVFAAITDYMDGILARRYAAVSDFGKLLDPLADKILVMAALVMLISLRDDRCVSFVPGWMVVLILAREFWVTGLRALASKDGTVVSAKSGGKVKSALQMVSILALLLYDYSFTFLGMRITFQFLGLNLLLLSIVFSYLSAIDYSVMVLAPQGKGLADITRQLGNAFLGESSSSKPEAGSTPTEPTVEIPKDQGEG